MFTIAARVLIAALSVGALSACESSPYSPSGASPLDTPDSINARGGTASCARLFETILTRERNGDKTGAINADLDELGARCPDRYDVFVDYVSIKGAAGVGAGGACSEYANYSVEAEAVRLARQDGFCSAGGRGETFSEEATWSCFYSPTYNNDWHDDVVCSNGAEDIRPHLRSWDNFVTEAEIMEAAREFEAELNDGWR